MTDYLYLSADEVKPGDILPDVSRFPVATVVTFPNEGVRVTFRGTEGVRHFPHGGPDYGFPAVRIERATPVEPDRLTLPNRERREAGMPYAYADGFGTWHAVIPANVAQPAKVAQRLIREELDMRGALGKGYRVRVKPEAGHRGKSTDSRRYVEV